MSEKPPSGPIRHEKSVSDGAGENVSKSDVFCVEDGSSDEAISSEP